MTDLVSTVTHAPAVALAPRSPTEAALDAIAGALRGLGLEG